MARVVLTLLAASLLSCSNDGVLLASRMQGAAGAGGSSDGMQALPSMPHLARDFVDTVGITVRVEDQADAAEVVASLEALSVRHARAFLPGPAYPERLDYMLSIGDAGMAWHLVYEPRFEYAPEQLGDALERFTTLESLEGPNDHDAYDIDLTAEQVTATMQELRAAIDQSGRPIALVDGLDSAVSGVGDLSAILDYGNFERLRTRELPGSDLSQRMAEARQICGDKPLFVTECGYADFANDRHTLSEEVIARYLPRLLLTHFDRGIVRTYLDELQDDAVVTDAVGSQGLLRGDGTPKPSFHSLQRFLRHFSDDGPSFAPATRELRYRAAAESVWTALFARSDGVLLIAVWNEVLSADLASGMTLINDPVSVVFELDSASVFGVYRPLISEAPIARGRDNRVELMVPDDVLLLALEPD